MSASANPKVSSFSLFPTRLVTLQFADVSSLNQSLCQLFEQQFGERFDMHPDSMNLLTLAESTPAISQLRDMFLQGAREWWGGVDASPPEEVDLVLFSNYSANSEFTLPHNHNADLVGIYYARAVEDGRQTIIDPTEDDDYFDVGNGELVIHDPRFNANMAAVGHRDYVKVAPQPGLMLIFPSYVWHTVAPHHGDDRRLSFSMNFVFKWPGKSNAVRERFAR